VLAAALRAGTLSAGQVSLTTPVCTADPSAQHRLVELVGQVSLAELRAECARVRAAADPDPEATNRRIHGGRRLRRYTDPDGSWNLCARCTPQAGAAFNAVLKLVITRGIDVLHVTHLGRGPTAAQRIARAWTSPHCSVLGCPRTRVQIDHRLDWAHTRHTRPDELDPLCPYHHDLKTRPRLGLVPGTGPRPFVPPHDPRHPATAPTHHPARPRPPRLCPTGPRRTFAVTEAPEIGHGAAVRRARLMTRAGESPGEHPLRGTTEPRPPS
jgi:hypothetical protein